MQVSVCGCPPSTALRSLCAVEQSLTSCPPPHSSRIAAAYVGSLSCRGGTKRGSTRLATVSAQLQNRKAPKSRKDDRKAAKKEKDPTLCQFLPERNYIRPSPPFPPFWLEGIFHGRGVGVYILRPHAAGILYAPLFYTPPTPRRVGVVSGVGVYKIWPCRSFYFSQFENACLFSIFLPFSGLLGGFFLFCSWSSQS